MNSSRIEKENRKRLLISFIITLLIHLFFIQVSIKNKDILLGERIIPIEIIDNLLDTGIGEETKRSQKRVNRPISQNKQKEAQKQQIKSLDEFKTFNNDLKIKKRKINKEKNVEKSIIKPSSKSNQSLSKESLSSGSKKGLNNNEPEKGSLKGLGKIKITCLKCIRPNYPPIALRRGAEGTPIIKVWINKNGKVTKAEFINISGIKSIDEAAKKAAINSTFYPIDRDSTINIEYDLKIK
tara:strand:- start:69 stop:785 length:717 start_codon:yes stop_codon:yes gene_type:complete